MEYASKGVGTAGLTTGIIGTALGVLILKSESGMYDIDLLEQIVTRTIDEYGDFPITVPAIKFISPTEKELRFTSDDVRKLKSYIES